EEYDPTTNTWTAKAPAPTSRAYASIGAIDGKLYVVGGCIDSDCMAKLTGILEEYDPVANSWSSKASMPQPRTQSTSGVIAGKLYVAGGFQACCAPLKRFEVYDPMSNSWSSLPDMPVAHSGVTGSASVAGLFYIPAGDGGGMPIAELDVYDPLANS